MGGMPHHPLPRLLTPGCRYRKFSSARAAHIYFYTRTWGRWSRLLGLEWVCGTIFLKYGCNPCSPRQGGRSRAEIPEGGRPTLGIIPSRGEEKDSLATYRFTYTCLSLLSPF